MIIRKKSKFKKDKNVAETKKDKNKKSSSLEINVCHEVVFIFLCSYYQTSLFEKKLDECGGKH